MNQQYPGNQYDQHHRNTDDSFSKMAGRAYDSTARGVRSVAHSRVVKSTKKRCCQPGLNEVEEAVLKAPRNTPGMLVFRYETNANSYDLSSYEPYKANNCPLEDIETVLTE